MKTNVDVKTVALQRAVQMLNSINAKYKIVTEDGDEYGTLELAKQPKRYLAFPMGEVRDHYSPLVKGLQPGETVKVPVKEYGFDRIQGGIGAFAGKLWGAGSVVTTRHANENVVEVLRIF